LGGGRGSWEVVCCKKHDREGRDVDEPLELLALSAGGPAQAQEQGGRRNQGEEQEQEKRDGRNDLCDRAEWRDAQRIGNLGLEIFEGVTQRPRREGGQAGSPGNQTDGEAAHGLPATRHSRPVG